MQHLMLEHLETALVMAAYPRTLRYTALLFQSTTTLTIAALKGARRQQQRS
jgi:hypothetical protein